MRENKKTQKARIKNMRENKKTYTARVKSMRENEKINITRVKKKGIFAPLHLVEQLSTSYRK